MLQQRIKWCYEEQLLWETGTDIQSVLEVSYEISKEDFIGRVEKEGIFKQTIGN
jgi:hypothetical protein